MSAAKSLVLLTGATGFQGSEILRQLLLEGYKVRATARSTVKAEQLKKVYSSHSDQIEVAIVENQLDPNAFKSAVKGVSAIFHVASPYTMKVKDVKTELIEPAINITLSVLEAAITEPSVKRILLTSSFAAVMNPLEGGPWRSYEYSEKDWNPLTAEQVIPANEPRPAYLASKKLAEQSAWDFIKNRKPHFDLVTFCPPMIYGPCAQPITSMKSLNTSTEVVYNIIDAKEVPIDGLPFFCNVQDVARAQILALNNPKASNQRYILYGGNYFWQQVADAAREKYPELRDRIPVGTPGVIPTKTLATVDVSKVQNDLGIKFQDWKTTIVDQTIGQLLNLEKELNERH